MRSKRTKDRIDKLSKKYKVSSSQVQEVVESPFRFFIKIANEGDKENFIFHSLRIMNWGLFSVKKGRIEFFKKLANNDNIKT